MTNKYIDFHAHTVFSDGTETIQNSILLRKNAFNINMLGVSDHYAYIKNNWKEYILEIEKQNELLDDVSVLKGVECLFTELNSDIDVNFIEALDFIIIEEYERIPYKEFINVIQILINKFSGWIILAHPEYPEWCSNISEQEVLKTLNFCYQRCISIELNLSVGYFVTEGYLVDGVDLSANPYWQLLEKSRVHENLCIGSDFHEYDEKELNEIAKNYRMARDFLSR